MLDGDRLSKNTDAGIHIKTPYTNDAYQNFSSNGSMFNLFGVRSNMEYNGEFKVDDANGLILLDNDYSYDYIILEYLSNPTQDTDLVIPIQAQEALIAWIRWKDIESMPASRRANQGEKITRKREYYRWRKIARARLNPLRLWDTNEVIRLNNNLVLKS
jgi:hypothetical protein